VYVSGKCTVAKRLRDPDAVWRGDFGRSSDGCIRWGWLSSNEKGQCFGCKPGHPIVTNGDFVA